MVTLTEASFRCQLSGDRLCVINSGKAYDVTDFADRHPGGRELIEKHVGQDVTQVMKSHDTHKHSPNAYKILEKYYIGDIQMSNGLVKRAKSKTKTNGHLNGYANRHTNGHANGHSNTNGHANGHIESTIPSDDPLDLSKPLFWRVGSLGEKYMKWVHTPVDTPLRLFDSEICEHLSKSYWWLVLLCWLPVSFGVIWYTFRKFQTETVYWNLLGLGEVEVPIQCYPVLFIIGFLLWTIDEYVVHRWLFHCTPPSWSNLLITLHFIFHGQHHKAPMDKHRLLFPPVPATLLAFLIYHVYRLLAPPTIAQVFFAGTIVGYLCYDLIHYYLHHGNPSLHYFKDLKTYHVKHHFKDHYRGFGISSKLWDYPFGTLIK